MKVLALKSAKKGFDEQKGVGSFGRESVLPQLSVQNVHPNPRFKQTEIILDGGRPILKVCVPDKPSPHLKALLEKHQINPKVVAQLVSVHGVYDYGTNYSRSFYDKKLVEPESISATLKVQLAIREGEGEREINVEIEVGNSDGKTKYVLKAEGAPNLRISVDECSLVPIVGHRFETSEAVSAFSTDYVFTTLAESNNFDERVALAKLADFRDRREILDAATRLLDAVSKGKRHLLYIHGDNGVGKTYLMLALAKAVFDSKSEIDGRLINANTLDNSPEVYESIGDAREVAIRAFRSMATDEFSNGMVSPWFIDDISDRGPSSEVLLSVASGAYDHGGVVVVTSNLPFDELLRSSCLDNAREIGRMKSRIGSFLEVLELKGPDLRMS